MEGWLSGRKHLTANEAVRNGTGVRISHLPQTPRVVQRANPVSRQNHLLRSLTWCKQPGRKPVRCISRNGSERDRQAEGVERDGTQSVSTTRGDKVSSEPRSGHELAPTCKE